MVMQPEKKRLTYELGDGTVIIVDVQPVLSVTTLPKPPPKVRAPSPSSPRPTRRPDRPASARPRGPVPGSQSRSSVASGKKCRYGRAWSTTQAKLGRCNRRWR